MLKSEYHEVELFRIPQKGLESILSSMSAQACSLEFIGNKARNIIPDSRDLLYHLARQMTLDNYPTTVCEFDNGPKLVALGNFQERKYFPYGLEEPDYEINVKADQEIKLSLKDNFIERIIRSLLSNLIHTKLGPPFQPEDNYHVIDTSETLSDYVDPSAKTDLVLKSVKIHPGFSYALRQFNEEYFLQISPSSRLLCMSSLDVLLQGGYSTEKIIDVLQYGEVLRKGSGRRILNFTNLTINDKIMDEPYFGRSFKTYAESVYSEVPLDDKAHLVQLAFFKPLYFPVNIVFPSLNFKSLSGMNSRYYSSILGIMKAKAAARPVYAKEIAQKIANLARAAGLFSIEESPLTLPYGIQPVIPEQFADHYEFQTGIVFSTPSVALRRFGEEIEVRRGDFGCEANVNDLMRNRELKPVDVPDKIDVVVFILRGLEQGWNALRESIITGNGGYRGLSDTFGTTAKFKEFVVDDFFSEGFNELVDSIPQNTYHCALAVIPRQMKTELETRQIYNISKAAIMRKGIPVQVVTDDPRKSYNQNNSLRGKATNAYYLFGLAINILAKVGAILTCLSKSVADSLIPNAMILGYDVTRVIPADRQIARSIPISAPLVMFDNQGAYLKHQRVYRLQDHNSLFRLKGDEIFSDIAEAGASTLVIHKDGPFYPDELQKLTELEKNHGINAIPISIIKNDVPRVNNPHYQGSNLRIDAGTCLPLSPKEFLMVTTPTAGWVAQKRGWPNPILIRIHKDSMDKEQRIKLLYHIFALTKMQTGSQRATRLPISIHFANMIDHFIKRVGDPTPDFLGSFTRKGASKGYLPRWFL